MFVWYECSVRIVRNPLYLSHALVSIDFRIDKQELVRNKVLKVNSLCGSDTMDVIVRRQFEGKIFRFRKKGEPLQFDRYNKVILAYISRYLAALSSRWES